MGCDLSKLKSTKTLLGILIVADFGNWTPFLSIILYLAAICSALSISISPTIYASGPRVFFVTDILIVVAIGLILSELLRKWRINIFVILVSILIFWNSFVLYLEYILNKG